MSATLTRPDGRFKLAAASNSANGDLRSSANLLRNRLGPKLAGSLLEVVLRSQQGFVGQERHQVVVRMWNSSTSSPFAVKRAILAIPSCSSNCSTSSSPVS
jgi:hypothetical protein